MSATTTVPFESTNLGKAFAVDGEKTLSIVMSNMEAYTRCKAVQGLLVQCLKIGAEDAIVSRYLTYVGLSLEDITAAAPEYRVGASTEVPTYPTMARISLEVMRCGLPVTGYKRTWKRLADAVVAQWAIAADEENADWLINELLDIAELSSLDDATLANSFRQGVGVPIARLLRQHAMIETYVATHTGSRAIELAQSLISAFDHLFVSLCSKEELSMIWHLARTLHGSLSIGEALMIEANRLTAARTVANQIEQRLSAYVLSTCLRNLPLITELAIDSANKQTAVDVMFLDQDVTLSVEDARAAALSLLKGDCIPLADYPLTVNLFLEQHGSRYLLANR